MISATHYRAQAEINRQSQLSTDIATLQVQIATGVRIQSASDDPAAAARVAVLRQRQADQAGWKANVTAAATTASAADAGLSNVQTAIQRVQELLIQANSATASASDRSAIATELGGIAQDLAGYASQTDSTGQPLFPASPLAIPIGQGVTTTATPSRADVFTIGAAGGGTIDLATFVSNAATSVAGGASLGGALTTVGGAVDQLADAQAAQGVRGARLDAAGKRLATAAVDTEAERGTLEATDVTRAVAELQAKLTTLEAAQALLVKVSQSNLFDKIR